MMSSLVMEPGTTVTGTGISPELVAFSRVGPNGDDLLVEPFDEREAELVQRLPLGCELDPGTAPLEQDRPHLLFQGSDLQRDGGLAEMEDLAGARHAAKARGGAEGTPCPAQDDDPDRPKVPLNSEPDPSGEGTTILN